MKKAHKNTIFRQLVIFSLLISIIPSIFISVSLYVRVRGMAEDDLSESHKQIVSQYIKNVKDKLDHYQMCIRLIADNTSLIRELTNSGGNSYRRGSIISEEVSKSLFLKESSEVRNCMVYSSDESNPIYGSSASMISIAEKEPWYEYEKFWHSGWFTYYQAEARTNIFSFVQPIYADEIFGGIGYSLGTVKLDIKLNNLLEPASNRNYHVYVSNEAGELLYSSDKYNNGRIWSRLQDGQKLSEYKQEYQTLPDYGIHFLILFEQTELQKKNKEVLYLIIPVLLVVLIVAVFAASLYSRYFSYRIGRLVKKFETAETGDLHIYDNIEGTDEIAELDQKFNQMIDKLNALIQRNYVQKLEKKETQLRNLQLQINPHFLYNTLETISSLAAIKNMFDVCDMCQKLGEIFRYSLGRNYGEFVTVEQELHHTKNYIFIQKMRYGNRFEAFYNIEADINRQKLLRFILQPIVENAIVHGWGELAINGTLEISIYNDENIMIVKIEDDGVGMNADKVAELTAYINNTEELRDTKKSIGIRNVNQRIKLSCGEEYGITIESSIGKGSCFIIRLPYIE